MLINYSKINIIVYAVGSSWGNVISLYFDFCHNANELNENLKHLFLT